LFKEPAKNPSAIRIKANPTFVVSEDSVGKQGKEIVDERVPCSEPPLDGERDKGAVAYGELARLRAIEVLAEGIETVEGQATGQIDR
jgi:hypothetical protein